MDSNGISIRNLFYAADPMCSWCWGFAPTIVEILKEFKERCSIHLLMGGLRAGEDAKPLDHGMRRHLERHWGEVEKASGQPFNRALLDRENFIYDTEPPCRAVITVRQLRPELELLYFHHLQDAFYRRNRDITQPLVLEEIAETLGLDPYLFRMKYSSRDMENQADNEFKRVRGLGVDGFPTLMLEARPGEFSMICKGWRDTSSVVEQLRPLLEK